MPTSEAQVNGQTVRMHKAELGAVSTTGVRRLMLIANFPHSRFPALWFGPAFFRAKQTRCRDSLEVIPNRGSDQERV